MSTSPSEAESSPPLSLWGRIKRIRRLPERASRLLWWPVQQVYMRNARLRRAVAWARYHRRSVTATILVLAHLLGAASSVNVLAEPRTPQGAIAWIISLNTFPYLAVPLYWTVGETDYSEYAIAYRSRQAEGASILKYLNRELDKRGLAVSSGDETGMLLTRLAHLPVTRGNSVEILVDGQETFDAMFQAIRNAQDYVLVEFYILKDDQLGQRLQRLLIERARSGLRVLVLYDEYGSRGLSAQYTDELREAGVRVYGFNPPLEDVSPTRLNFRNHRKIVVVDGLEAFVGGHNVGDEYYYGDSELGRYRDTHVRIRGPLVQCSQIVFAEDWHAVSQELLQDLNWSPEAISEPGMLGLCFPSGPADEFESASMFFLQLINSANDRVWIASPYFVPDQQMVTALQMAALRGVDVRLMIPSESDSRLVWLSSYSYLPELEAAGIRTFRYRGRFMHQKVILVDEDVAAVGTANFDNRSFRLNFEVMMVMFDHGFAKQTAEMLVEDFRQSVPAHANELTDSSFVFQGLVRAARLLAPIQ